MFDRRFAPFTYRWVLSILCFVCLPCRSIAGAGISLLTIFDLAPEGQTTSATASSVADALHEQFHLLMQDHEVWGIELLNRDAATSAALHYLGDAAPRWEDEWTSAWISLLNTNEMITYAVLGSVTSEPDGQVAASIQLRDFILNHEILSTSATAATTRELGAVLAPRVLRALQLYFAEVIESGQGKALINVGLESLSTGTMLTVFAHGHMGAHRAGYPAHGHREEDDHLLGSNVYIRYRGTAVTSSTVHTHSRSHWRSLLREFAPAYDSASTASVTSSTAGTDMTTSATEEELRLLNLAHFHSGRPTGTLRVKTFLKPHPYYNAWYAVADIVEGFAIPGSFVRVKR